MMIATMIAITPAAANASGIYISGSWMEKLSGSSVTSNELDSLSRYGSSSSIVTSAMVISNSISVAVNTIWISSPSRHHGG